MSAKTHKTKRKPARTSQVSKEKNFRYRGWIPTRGLHKKCQLCFKFSSGRNRHKSDMLADHGCVCPQIALEALECVLFSKNASPISNVMRVKEDTASDFMQAEFKKYIHPCDIVREPSCEGPGKFPAQMFFEKRRQSLDSELELLREGHSHTRKELVHIRAVAIDPIDAARFVERRALPFELDTSAKSRLECVVNMLNRKPELSMCQYKNKARDQRNKIKREDSMGDFLAREKLKEANKKLKTEGKQPLVGRPSHAPQYIVKYAAFYRAHPDESLLDDGPVCRADIEDTRFKKPLILMYVGVPHVKRLYLAAIFDTRIEDDRELYERIDVYKREIDIVEEQLLERELARVAHEEAEHAITAEEALNIYDSFWKRWFTPRRFAQLSKSIRLHIKETRKTFIHKQISDEVKSKEISNVDLNKEESKKNDDKTIKRTTKATEKRNELIEKKKAIYEKIKRGISRKEMEATESREAQLHCLVVEELEGKGNYIKDDVRKEETKKEDSVYQTERGMEI